VFVSDLYQGIVRGEFHTVPMPSLGHWSIFMTNRVEHHCRVCGLFHEDPPWGEDNKTPTYDICPCCGVEFGYGDTTPDNARALRHDWVEQGCAWQEPREKPGGWDANSQMGIIPPRFR